MQVTLKLKYDGLVRRVPLKNHPLTIEEIHGVISSLFEMKEGSYLLSYKDEEGDKIVVSSDAELEEAVQISGGGPALLRLDLEKIHVPCSHRRSGGRRTFGRRQGDCLSQLNQMCQEEKPENPEETPVDGSSSNVVEESPVIEEAPKEKEKEKEEKEEEKEEKEKKKEKLHSFVVPLGDLGELSVEIERSACTYHALLELTPSSAFLAPSPCPDRRSGGRRHCGRRQGNWLGHFLLSQLNQMCPEEKKEVEKKSENPEETPVAGSSSDVVEGSESVAVDSSAGEESVAGTPSSVSCAPSPRPRFRPGGRRHCWRQQGNRFSQLNQMCPEEKKEVEKKPENPEETPVAGSSSDVVEESVAVDSSPVGESVVGESAVVVAESAPVVEEKLEEEKRARALEVILPLGFDAEVVNSLLDVVGNDVEAAVAALVG